MGSPRTLRESTSERRNMNSAHIRPEPAVRPMETFQTRLVLRNCPLEHRAAVILATTAGAA